MHAVRSHFGLCLARMFSGHIPWVVFEQSSADVLKSEGPGLQNGVFGCVTPPVFKSEDSEAKQNEKGKNLIKLHLDFET